MKKIAFIVQQYGVEMYGGAELHCMRLAEKMASFYKVEVLTTCSFDFLTWANHYPEGESEINGVTVRRFKVSQIRSWEKMAELEKKVKHEKQVSAQKNWIKLICEKLALLKRKKATKEDYINWVVAQGPTTPDLINFIAANEKDYDCLIFFTYLYYPTIFGININPKKTIFIPLAHDEWAIYMPVFKSIFNAPACIMYNTPAEKRLVNRLFKNESVYSQLAGTWVDMPVDLPEQDIKEKMKISGEYILYVGRIDDFKIAKQDFEWFLQYVKETKRQTKLVLVGNLYIDIPISEHIMYLGFVDKVTKFNLIKQSLFLFQPSRFESLSIVVLEAFAMEKPVLVHQYCEVMKDHVDKSQGGFYYHDYTGFKQAFNKLTGDWQVNREAGKSGKLYIDNNYLESIIIDKYRNVIENRICRPKN